MHFAQRTLTGGHCRAQCTRARIKLHLTWPGIRKDVSNFVSQCKDCSLRIGLRRSDHVPITPIVRPTLPFLVAHADIIGPLDPSSSAGHKYCLTIVDACTRWCWCYPLRTVTSQAVCDCLLDLFQNTGVFKVIVMDNASNFCSVLTTEFLKRLGVSPRFVAPYHAEANRLVERFNSSFKMFCTLPCVNLAEVGTKLFHCWSGCSASSKCNHWCIAIFVTIWYTSTRNVVVIKR